LKDIIEELEKKSNDEKLGFLNSRTLFLKYSGNTNRDEKINAISLIEKVIQDTCDELLNALETGTHRHKKSMVHGVKKQLIILECQLVSSWNKIDDFLINFYKQEINEFRELFMPIFDIISKDFTHWQQKNLLKPYLFPFQAAEFRSFCYRDRYRKIKAQLVTYFKKQIETENKSNENLELKVKPTESLKKEIEEIQEDQHNLYSDDYEFGPI